MIDPSQFFEPTSGVEPGCALRTAVAARTDLVERAGVELERAGLPAVVVAGEAPLFTEWTDMFWCT